ncbi:transketolase [bacterium]|nr:transketolase [bacterium]
MPRLGWNANQLQEKALDVRRDIITLLANAGSGHSGGSLSCTDFATALFFNRLRVEPREPMWEKRDFWNFSIGHVTPVIYSVMAERGYFPLKDLLGFRQFNGHLQGHPSAHDTPGIEVSAGSIGQGLSIAIGVALASKLDKNPRHCWCIMGDGEQQEGSIWEAAMSAGHYKLDNLTAIIDVNRKQIDGDTVDVMNVEPLADKYRAFNWHVIDVDGHDIQAILAAFDEAENTPGKPSVILARTVMGKGVSFMEDKAAWHGNPPSHDEAKIALEELGTDYDTWYKRLAESEGSRP